MTVLCSVSGYSLSLDIPDQLYCQMKNVEWRSESDTPATLERDQQRFNLSYGDRVSVVTDGYSSRGISYIVDIYTALSKKYFLDNCGAYIQEAPDHLLMMADGDSGPIACLVCFAD